MRYHIRKSRVRGRHTKGGYRSVRRRKRARDLETRVVRAISLGTILSGAAVCLASVGAGLSLMLVATVVLAEV